MAARIEDFSAEEFDKQLVRLCKGIVTGCVPSAQPKGFLLGGQSGAGKTRLQKIILGKHGSNFVIINGDEFRGLHPRFAQIQQRYGIDAPAHTAAWSGQMVEALVDALSREGYNLIIEGTLRTSSVPLATAIMLRERGYASELALMAVKPEVSLASCKIRYERMCQAGTTPRAVDPAHHEQIVKDIAGNLAELERSEVFDAVSLYNRAGTCLFTAHCPTKGDPASAALRDILFGAWTEEEKEHYAALLKELATYS